MIDATGGLISGRDAYRWILGAIAEIDRPIDFCSAFLRSEALNDLLENVPKSLTGRVLVRWRLGDFLAGASDFAAYEAALSHGLRMYMRLDFHGKIYSLPPHGIVVGSANATQAGLGTGANVNTEVCTLAPCCEANLEVIDGLYGSAVEIDPELLIDLQKIVNEAPSRTAYCEEWPSSIVSRLSGRQRVTALQVADCFWGSPDWIDSSFPNEIGQSERHDIFLLGFDADEWKGEQSKERLIARVRNTVIVQWLLNVLIENNGVAYFGYLSSQLHASITDIPCPSREEVKILLQRLLDWVSTIKIDEVEVDRPGHSQRVRMVK